MFQKGLLFGTFDGLHEGHLDLLRQAKEQTEYLVVAVATDETILTFKKFQPINSFEVRKQKVLESGYVSEVCESVGGDGYQCILKQMPNCVFTGYDQDALREHLLAWLKEHKMDIPVITLSAHHPHLYKSSLLYDRS